MYLITFYFNKREGRQEAEQKEGHDISTWDAMGPSKALNRFGQLQGIRQHMVNRMGVGNLQIISHRIAGLRIGESIMT